MNELGGRGLGVVTLNHGDPAERVRSYLQQSGFGFPVALGGRRGAPGYEVFSRYGIHVYPTNYLIDGQGRIVYRAIGWDEAAVRAALAQLGVR